jgi:hypothetical protein
VIHGHAVTRGRRALLAALALCGGVAGCAASPHASGQRAVAAGSAALTATPATRAERTSYLETSRYADVVSFLDSLRVLGVPYAFGSIGKSHEGRDIPYVIASRPLVRTPQEARASGRPIVYVQANIHAGEVEGKEALLALLRDLAQANAPGVLDSIVLIAVPIYNADGNERVGPQERQRSEQNGPELVGQRPNAQGLDLNRDYVKAEAPETRASLAMFNAWDPDVFVDLHTTDGSFHGYALTYSPSLNPAAPLGPYTRRLLAELRTRVRDRDGVETFDYGNFDDPGGEVTTDTVHASWSTYDHRPRFGTNYYGLRGRIGILSEAYSHDPFERRVRATYAFVRELLSMVAERGRVLRAMKRGSDTDAHVESYVAIRAALPATAAPAPVTYEVLARTGDSSLSQPGVPRGLRRTGELRTRSIPVFDRFVATLSVKLPDGYLVGARDTALLGRLALHGVTVTELPGLGPERDRPFPGAEEFVVDSIARSPREFQRHHEVRLVGHWAPAAALTRRDWRLAHTDNHVGILATYLLDPQSDDSFVTWNVLDASLAVGSRYPVLRLPSSRLPPQRPGLPR